jgi:hypothetical protein
MATTIRWDMASMKVLGVDTLILTDATETDFDFGTPDDINLAAEASYDPGDRILIVFAGRAATGQTTDAVTWAVYDAPDDGGSIGTPATASTHVIDGALVGAVTEDTLVIAVEVQPGRPWIRCSADMQGTTDDYHVSCVVLAVPSNA